VKLWLGTGDERAYRGDLAIKFLMFSSHFEGQI